MCTKTRNRHYANMLCHWWAKHDPSFHYYIRDGDPTKHYAPREELKALGLPDELEWGDVWPALWPAK